MLRRSSIGPPRARVHGSCTVRGPKHSPCSPARLASQYGYSASCWACGTERLVFRRRCFAETAAIGLRCLWRVQVERWRIGQPPQSLHFRVPMAERRPITGPAANPGSRRRSSSRREASPQAPQSRGR